MNLIISPTVLIVDSDTDAAEGIADWLSQRPERPEVTTASSVRAAQHVLELELVDWLFISVEAWDDYQKIAPALPHRPGPVVFLSARDEHHNSALETLVDAYLKPPVVASQLLKIWIQLSAPSYQFPPLDFFFLRTGGGYVPVRYPDLREVRRMGNRLQVDTRYGAYMTAGCITGFQARVPVPLTLVDPGWLVNEACRTFT